MHYLRTTTDTRHCVLYRVVFSCVYTKCAVAVLFLAFLLQPVAPTYAYAAASSTPPTADPAADESETDEEEMLEAPTDPETVTDTNSEEQEVEANTSEDEEVDTETRSSTTNASDDADPSLGTEATIGEELETDASSTDPASDTTESDSETTSSSPGASSTSPIEPQTQATTTLATTSVVATSTASSTDTETHATSSSDTSATSSADSDTGVAASTTERMASSSPSTGSTSDPVAASTTQVTTPTTSSEAQIGDDDAVHETATSSEQSVSTEDPETATSTVAGTSTSTLPSVHYSDTNRYQFGADDCVSVGDGSYYCSSGAEAADAGSDDRLYVGEDGDGDREIFMRLNGDTLQLSHNRVDDLAPHYDALSESVVWHRLVDGRYQIVSYDLGSEEEAVLTDNDTNDMEPARAGDHTVWQRWIDGNWEVMLFDGDMETRITNNGYHDVAPSIRGGYVIWHSNPSGQSKVEVYEIETGLTSTIDDGEGGDIANPRFVLVYDTTYENGDIVTKGYDLESGELMPLAAVPAELPDEIPEPDSTGETRALIQNKSNSKEEVVIDQDGGASGTSTASTSASNKSATTTSPTASSADIAGASSTSEVVDLREEAEALELTEFDVVVTPYDASNTNATNTQQVDSESATSSLE